MVAEVDIRVPLLVIWQISNKIAEFTFTALESC